MSCNSLIPLVICYDKRLSIILYEFLSHRFSGVNVYYDDVDNEGKVFIIWREKLK